MIIKAVPQKSDRKMTLKVDVQAEVVTANMNGIEDTFDFSNFGDGELDVSSIETVLPINPILKAKRENGELYLELLHWYQDSNAPEEVRFPQPQTYTEGVVKIG